MDRCIPVTKTQFIEPLNMGKHEDMLAQFCYQCGTLGYKNNSSFKDLKLDRIQYPVGKYWVAIDKEKNDLFAISGIQYLPEIHERAWRILFRGCQLSGYIQKRNFHLWDQFWPILYPIYESINWVYYNFGTNWDFYGTTTLYKDDSGRSIRSNKTLAPWLAKKKIARLEYEDIELYYVQQNVWKINVDELFKQIPIHKDNLIHQEY